MVLYSGYWSDWSINNVAMLLVVCQLSCDAIGYKDS